MTDQTARIILDGLAENPLFNDSHKEALKMGSAALSESTDIDKILFKAELIKTYKSIFLEKDQVARIVDIAEECFKSNNKGTWKDAERGIECSQCGVKIMTARFRAKDYVICPNCFADMRGEAK